MIEQGISRYVILIAIMMAVYVALEAFSAPVLIHAAAKVDGCGNYDVKAAINDGLVNWGWFIALDFLWLGAMVVAGLLLFIPGLAIARVSRLLLILYFLVEVMAGTAVSVGLGLALAYIRRIVVLESSNLLEAIRDGFFFLFRNKTATTIIFLTLALVYFGYVVLFGLLLTAQTLAKGGFPSPEELGQYQSSSLDWVLGFLDIVVSSVLMTVTTNLFTVLYLRLRPPVPQSQPLMEAPPLPS